jgi:phage FluMu gp28-like protein
MWAPPLEPAVSSSEEGRKQKAEGGRQKAEGGRQKAESSRQEGRPKTEKRASNSDLRFDEEGPKTEKRKTKSDKRVSNFDFPVSDSVNPKSNPSADGQNQKSSEGAAACVPAGGTSGISPLPPALRLLPYQRRWVEDNAPLKLAVKARQIGYSFAATLRAVLRCLEHKTTWIFLSKGERQSRLLMEKVQDHIRSCGIVARTQESTFFEGTLIKQLETRFPNGSVIYGLPANPDTARGYSGHVTLDEFAFHADADKIYAALYPTITRGYGLEVISTPNGTQGKFYGLAKAAGLTEQGLGIRDRGLGKNGAAANPQSPIPNPWSVHNCDIYDAIRQGLKIDLELLRSGCEDESAWQQEFCCQFVSTAENFFPPELLAASLSAEASTDTPLPLLVRESGAPFRAASSAPGASSGLGTGDWGLGTGPSPQPPAPSTQFFLGLDIGRHHDRTVFWLDEVQPAKLENRNWKIALPSSHLESPVSSPSSEIHNFSVARLVRTFTNTPFAEQLSFARELLSLLREDGRPLVRRAAIDATGMGAPLAEALAREFGPRVEPVVFTSAAKEDLAFRTKRRMEARLTLLPDTREIRRAFSAVKKIVTPSGNLRFDAERTDAGHADEFWAKALADLAADSRPAASHEEAFLVDGAPLVSPTAFAEVDSGFSILEF